MEDRQEFLFIGAVLALVAGVPLALYSIYYFADSIELVAALILAFLVVLSISGLLIARYKDKILEYFTRSATTKLEDLADPLSDAAGSFGSGDPQKGREDLARFFRGGFSYIAWLRTRQWIIGSSVALLLGFAGLVGSALLKQQNDLILEQNAYFRNQIDQQAQLIELQQEVSNQTVRSEAIRRIYGSEYAATPRVKAEALRSLIAIERLRIAADNNTLVSSFINLHESDFSGAWLENADLAGTSWRAAKANRANMSATNLTRSVFRFTELESTVFLNAILEDAVFSYAMAPNAKLASAKLTSAAFVKSDLKGADFSGADVTEASFVGSNLQGAVLNNLQNWRMIKSIESSNVFGVLEAPDGFIEWALENGAISEEGALNNLAVEAAEYRAEFELDTRQ